MDEVQEIEVKVVSGPPAVAPDRLLAEIERDGVKVYDIFRTRHFCPKNIISSFLSRKS